MNGKIRLFIFIVILLVCSVLFSGCTTTTVTTTIQSSCDPRAIEINLIDAVRGQFSQGDNFDVYCVYVPEGNERFVVDLFELTADFDLFVGYGSYSSIEYDDFDVGSSIPGIDKESVIIEYPEPGYYYIQVYNSYGLSGDYTVNAYAFPGGSGAPQFTPHTGCGAGTYSVTSGETVDIGFSSIDEYVIYCIEVTAGQFLLEVYLDELESDFDIYIVYGRYPDISSNNYDWASLRAGITPESVLIKDPVAGIYYVMVYHTTYTLSNCDLFVETSGP